MLTMADQNAPRKQRHTVKRVYDRLKEEHIVKFLKEKIKNYR